MFRYPGSKWNASAHIVKYIRNDVTAYVEPFLGSGGVWRRLMTQGRSFASVLLNDADSSVTEFWTSVKNGAFLPRLTECRDRLSPELFHEDEIREEFELSKDRWVHDGDSFAWFFLRLYAVGQFVQTPEDRRNVASFDPMYLGSGIDKETPETWAVVRSWLEEAQITNQSALKMISDLLPIAGSETMVYLDPPYPVAKGKYKMYGIEPSHAEHQELCNLLKQARFKWLLSMPFNTLVNDIYVKNTDFQTRLIPTRQGGHLGRCKHTTREYEWLILPVEGGVEAWDATAAKRVIGDTYRSTSTDQPALRTGTSQRSESSLAVEVPGLLALSSRCHRTDAWSRTWRSFHAICEFANSQNRVTDERRRPSPPAALPKPKTRSQEK
jgi:site-specific DNA-adenine methylase